MPEGTILHLISRRIFTAACSLAMLTASASDLRIQAQSIQKPTQPIKLPKNYRKWRLISVAHEEGDLHDLRAILANDLAARAFLSNAVQFPSGSKIVRLAWQYSASADNNRAFGREQSFVAGSPTNIQLMVRDSRRYAATSGWGYAQFADPGAKNEAAHPGACAGCHLSAIDHGFVFTRYSR
jgi:hypothetical protein